MADNTNILSAASVKVKTATPHIFGKGFPNMIMIPVNGKALNFIDSNEKFFSVKRSYKIAVDKIKFTGDQGNIGVAERFTIAVY